MDAQTELQLIALAQAGDAAAMRSLLDGHRPFVVMVIKSIIGSTRELDDYLTIGLMSLVRSIRKFEPERKCRLLTPAKIAIYRDVKRAYRTSGLIKLPVTPIVERYRARAEATYRMASSDLRYDDGGLIFQLAAQPEPVDDPDLRDRVHRAIAQIKPRLQDIIRLRMKGLSLEEVGRIMGVTRERIRMLQADAFHELAPILDPTAVVPDRKKRACRHWVPREDAAIKEAARLVLSRELPISVAIPRLSVELGRTHAAIQCRINARMALMRLDPA